MSLDAAHLCLALNLYHEGRGESYTGQYAIVHVVRNRAKYNLENVCKVVFKPYQFSWTITMPPDNQRGLERALHISSLAWDSPADVTYGATHYHAAHIKPYWAAQMRVTARIGNHIFYRKK